MSHTYCHCGAPLAVGGLTIPTNTAGRPWPGSFTGDTMTKPKTKWCSGPVGMACGCCRIGKRSRAKRGYSRTVRRETRQALALEVTHAEL